MVEPSDSSPLPWIVRRRSSLFKLGSAVAAAAVIYYAVVKWHRRARQRLLTEDEYPLDNDGLAAQSEAGSSSSSAPAMAPSAAPVDLIRDLSPGGIEAARARASEWSRAIKVPKLAAGLVAPLEPDGPSFRNEDGERPFVAEPVADEESIKAMLPRSPSGTVLDPRQAASEARAELPGQLKSQAGKAPAKFAAFVSHYKMEAAMEARFIKMELEQRLGAPIFLDSDDLRNLNQLQACVLASQVLVIVQSSGVYKRPYVLLELCTAIAYHIPIVAVQICGGPFAYDFAESAEFLQFLDQRLSTSEAKVLRDHGVSLLDCAWKLSEIVPFVISTRLDPGFSRAVLTAVISDLVEAMRLAQAPLLVAPQATDEQAHRAWLKHRDSIINKKGFRGHEHGAPPPGMTHRRRSSSTVKPALPPSTAPELPEAYDPSGTMAAAVTAHAKRALTENETATAVHRVCLRGLGGAGKTTLAVALSNDPAVLACFEAVAWLTVGDEPELPELQASLLSQWQGEKTAADSSVHGGSAEPKAALRKATKGRRLLLVLDDVCNAADAAALCVLDDATTSACLVTTRLQGVFAKNATEVCVGPMAPDEALKLLLRAGQVEHLLMDPPPAALAAVAACGALPLALEVAGAMIEEHADDWHEWLGPTLACEHAAELREHELPAAAQGAADELETLEERLVLASLQGLTDADTLSVFHHFAAFPPATAVPVAVFDACAPALLPPPDDGASLRRKSVKPPSVVRRALLELCRRSLLSGSPQEGFTMHVLVQAYVLAHADGAAGADGGGGTAPTTPTTPPTMSRRGMGRRVLEQLLPMLPDELHLPAPPAAPPATPPAPPVSPAPVSPGAVGVARAAAAAAAAREARLASLRGGRSSAVLLPPPRRTVSLAPDAPAGGAPADAPPAAAAAAAGSAGSHAPLKHAATVPLPSRPGRADGDTADCAMTLEAYFAQHLKWHVAAARSGAAAASLAEARADELIRELLEHPAADVRAAVGEAIGLPPDALAALGGAGGAR